jgi:hypothetical protein
MALLLVAMCTGCHWQEDHSRLNVAPWGPCAACTHRMHPLLTHPLQAHSDALLIPRVPDPYREAVQCVMDKKRAHPNARWAVCVFLDLGVGGSLDVGVPAFQLHEPPAICSGHALAPGCQVSPAD